MRRPYSEGDWFAVPLGDGNFAAGIVTHGTHKAICGSFFGPARAALPALAELAGSRPAVAWWSGRFSDRGLVELRWPLLGREPGFVREDRPNFRDSRVLGPGFVERTLAAIAAGAAYAPARRSVRDLGSPVDVPAPSASPGVRLQWRASLHARDLALVERYVAGGGGAGVRLYASATSQAGDLASWPALERLELESEYLPQRLPAFAHVRELVLDGVPRDLANVLDAFPALQTLRVRARGAAASAAEFARVRGLRSLDVDGVALTAAASLANLEGLRALDLRDSTVDDLDAVLRLALQALRLARVSRVRSIDALRGHAHLRVLALAGLMDVASVRPIESLDRLESLDLGGFWQFDIADVAFVASMPALRRLRLDIGGRRKNVEIYKRRALALPLPFYELTGAGVGGIANECGVQSLPMKPSSVTTSGSESRVSGSKGVV